MTKASTQVPDRWANDVLISKLPLPALVWLSGSTDKKVDDLSIIKGVDEVTGRFVGYRWEEPLPGETGEPCWRMLDEHPKSNCVPYDFKIDKLPENCLLPKGYEHLSVPDPDTAVKMRGKINSTVAEFDPGAGFNVYGFVSPLDGRPCHLAVWADENGVKVSIEYSAPPLGTVGEENHYSYREAFIRILGRDYWDQDEEKCIRANAPDPNPVAWYEILQTASGYRWGLMLLGKDEPILSAGGFANITSAEKAIALVQKTSPYGGNYVRREATSGRFTFRLERESGAIAEGPYMATSEGRDFVVEAAMKYGRTDVVRQKPLAAAKENP